MRKVTDMNSMFAYDTSFNGNISGWNISASSSIKGMFAGATSFNQN